MTAATFLLADGRFPAGGHAQSAGVEAAVRFGDVHDLLTLERYLHGRLATTGVVDSSFAAAACHADIARLDELGDELDARLIAPRSREISRRLGRQTLRAARAAWPGPRLDHLGGSNDGASHQAIVVGVVVGESGGTPSDAALLVLHHMSAAVTSAAVRLRAFDPIAVLVIQARLLPTLDVLATAAADLSDASPAELPAIGGALTEILAQDHGQWDARLFVA